MRKIKYLIRSIFAMNFGKTFTLIKKISKKHKRLKLFVFLDMLWCGVRYGAGQTDYYLMGFARMPGRLRRTYITRGVNNDFIKKLNNQAEYHKFENKITFNQLFSAYTGRDYINLAEKSPEDFIAFTQKHPVIIAKPTDLMCGQGIEKIDTNETTNITALYNRLKESGRILVEEYVNQHTSLAAMYPHSLNTLRLVTIIGDDPVIHNNNPVIHKDNPVHIVYRGLRMGKGGSIVDNMDSGGVIAVVDEKGSIFTHASDKNLNIYKSHPDTGVVFKGFVIPFFNEAQELVKKAAQVVKGVRYVGWDVAFTQSGPILIEGNHNPSSGTYQPRGFQLESETGLLPVFTDVIKKIR